MVVNARKGKLGLQLIVSFTDSLLKYILCYVTYHIHVLYDIITCTTY